jgi:hypothetical protein
MENPDAVIAAYPSQPPPPPEPITRVTNNSRTRPTRAPLVCARSPGCSPRLGQSVWASYRRQGPKRSPGPKRCDWRPGVLSHIEYASTDDARCTGRLCRSAPLREAARLLVSAILRVTVGAANGTEAPLSGPDPIPPPSAPAAGPGLVLYADVVHSIHLALTLARSSCRLCLARKPSIARSPCQVHRGHKFWISDPLPADKRSAV